jgi:LPS export ABC transporter protein LptC
MRPSALLVPALALAVMGMGCQKPQAVGPHAPVPELTLTGVTLHSFKGSSQVAVGTAKTLTFERSSGDSLATKATVELVPKGSPPGQKPYRLTADQMSGNTAARIADAVGNVTLHGDRGLKGVTRSAHYDGNTAVASGTDPLTLTGRRFVTRADGFTANLATDELLLEGDVQSRLGGRR